MVLNLKTRLKKMALIGKRLRYLLIFKNKSLVFSVHLTFWLNYIWRTFIHPSKRDSPYSPFSKGEWVFQNKIQPEVESPFLKDESPFWRVNRKRVNVGWIDHPSKGWIKKGWIDKGWMTGKSSRWLNWKKVDENKVNL